MSPHAKTDRQLDILELSSAELAQFQVIDIRDPNEEPSVRHLFALLRTDVKSMPLNTLDLDHCELDKKGTYLFVCAKGVQSERLVTELRQRGFENTYSIKGGVEAIRRKFIA